MSATFAPVAKAEAAIQTFRDGAEKAGSTLWGRGFMHLLHAAFFITFVIKRQATVLPLAAWLDRTLGTAMGGVPADAVRLAAASFDSIWTLVLRPIGL